MSTDRVKRRKFATRRIKQVNNQHLKKNQNGHLSRKLLQLEQNGRNMIHYTLV